MSRTTRRTDFWRLILFVTYFASASLLVGCGAHGHEKTVKTYKLAARETKTVTFKTAHKSRVSFITNLSAEDRAKCKAKCTRMYYQGKSGAGEIVTSPINGYLDITPEDGKVSFTVQNLEGFPIEMMVSWGNA